MRLFSYVVARDFGFAPNPFFGICSLATCKPRIRCAASIGDWIVGTGSKKHARQGSLVYIMRVTELCTFNQYWNDPRFQRKRPTLQGSLKQAFGDNIYYKRSNNEWHQLDSHHSYEGGVSNPHNIENDTQCDRVLIGAEYAYWGGVGPDIPRQFRDYNGYDLCAGRNHKSKFPADFVENFVIWFRSLNVLGYAGDPLNWPQAT